MAAAAVNPLVSLDEYLHSNYRPDMDFVDGLLEERNLGEHDHADLQTELAFLFRTHRNEWKVKAVVEQRIRVTPIRYRVPDLCILPASWKRQPIITEAPLLCIEVLSPEDRVSRIRARCDDYFSLGVREAWIFDPSKRDVLVLRPDRTVTTVSAGILTLPGTPIELDLAQVFSILDGAAEE